MANRITRQFRKVRPHVTGEVECVDCGHRWDVERDGADICAAKRAALAEKCPSPHHPRRVSKTRLGTVKVRRCADCGDRCQCTWDICPYEADVGGETDPAKALWLCEDCQSNRAASI